MPRPMADWLVTSTQAKPARRSLRERLGSAGQEPDLGRVGEVVDVLDQGPVPVQEDRRSEFALTEPRAGRGKISSKSDLARASAS